MDLAEELITPAGRRARLHRCAYAGSLRRMRDTIGDMDILAMADAPQALMTALTGTAARGPVVASGPTKTSIRTTAGIQADLRVVPEGSWGAALLYFTGLAGA